MTVARHIARSISLLVIGTFLSACSSEPPPPAAPPPPPEPASLTVIKGDILKVKAQEAITTDALNTLAASSSSNAQTNYNKFSEEYTKLTGLVDSNRGRVKDLKQRAQVYFDTWNKESGTLNPGLQRQYTEQRYAVETICNAIKSELELGKLSFDPYMANLKDIQSYLSTDISPARIGTTSDLIAKVNEDNVTVQKHLDNIVTNIDKLMASSGESPTGAPATIPAQ